LDHGRALRSFCAPISVTNPRSLALILARTLSRDHVAIRTKSTLVQTSILDRMCGPLCDAVVRADTQLGPHRDAELATRPIATGQDTLELLERANLFTVRLDDERRWYRYHHLFHAVLPERLRATTTPEEIATLHRRASAWLADNRLIPEAVEHP